jgi:hypothetical protein
MHLTMRWRDMNKSLLMCHDALTAENATENDDEESESSWGATTAKMGEDAEATNFDLEEEVNLRSVVLLDVLSDTPHQVQPHASVPQECTVDKESTINWDF